MKYDEAMKNLLDMQVNRLKRLFTGGITLRSLDYMTQNELQAEIDRLKQEIIDFHNDKFHREQKVQVIYDVGNGTYALREILIDDKNYTSPDKVYQRLEIPLSQLKRLKEEIESFTNVHNKYGNGLSNP